MKTEQESQDALVSVEKDGADRLKIRSDQFEQTGQKRRSFSVFSSIMLPIIVSAATAFFTGPFQYIGFTNELRLREATETAARAMAVSEKVSAAINQRKYATYVFISSLQNLVLEKNEKLDPEQSLLKPTLRTPANNLSALASELGKERFKTYYEKLKVWNEGIDQLVTDFDYALDRPIFIHAQLGTPGTHEGVGEYWQRMNNIDCLSSLPEELEKRGFDAKRLKMRLVGISYCFTQLHALLGRKREADGTDLSWDRTFNNELYNRLDYIDYMGNELRCYALQRVEYYNGLKERSIISPWSLWAKLMNEQKANALRHLEDAAKYCDPAKRREAARATDRP
jgi:hypothetical protein